MKTLTTTMISEARAILQEIRNSESEYFWPRQSTVGNKSITSFDLAYMKFLNGNLNPYRLENMVASTLEEHKFNPDFPETIKICESIRELTTDAGPFGRMCVWRVPPGNTIKPHRDVFPYHEYIKRIIFIISENINDELKIIVEDKKLTFNQGTVFEFSPFHEMHEFINNSTDDFFFLGYDYWHPEKLEYLQSTLDLSKFLNNPARLNGYGLEGKYVTAH